jgi:two-component system, chemotaxis family, sensor kinase Cph1
MGEARGGVVQPHGVLLTLDEPSLRVLQVSANVTELLHRPAERVIGAPVEGVLGQAARSALEGVNGDWRASRQPRS